MPERGTSPRGAGQKSSAPPPPIRQRDKTPAASTVRVLVVGDDTDAAEERARGLCRQGHFVRGINTGREALRVHKDADLVVLNLDLPDIDGLEVCRLLRRTETKPIISIAAHDAELDKVLALQAGSDDCIIASCGPREFVARVEAVLRRTQPLTPSDVEIRLGPLLIKGARREVYLHGSRITLTNKEFDLLQLLAAEPDTIVTRQRILQQVWHDTDLARSRTIDTHVNGLRRKLGGSRWIINVRGVGFRLVSPTAALPAISERGACA